MRDGSVLFVDLDQKPFLTDKFNGYYQRKKIDGDCDFWRCSFRAEVYSGYDFAWNYGVQWCVHPPDPTPVAD
jgi:hypothetical protein